MVCALASQTALANKSTFSMDEAKKTAQEMGYNVKTEEQTPRPNDTCTQSPSGHRINELPYWSMDFDLPCMYSGELLSSTEYENYFFYWLAPRPSDMGDTDTSPLVVYLNGGPGSTSMNALWTGNGPLRVTETGSDVYGKDFEITYDTDISW